ncbi:hypothetical protein ACJX0J_020112, partial [Zea mays]
YGSFTIIGESHLFCYTKSTPQASEEILMSVMPEEIPLIEDVIALIAQKNKRNVQSIWALVLEKDFALFEEKSKLIETTVKKISDLEASIWQASAETDKISIEESIKNREKGKKAEGTQPFFSFLTFFFKYVNVEHTMGYKSGQEGQPIYATPMISKALEDPKYDDLCCDIGGG